MTLHNGAGLLGPAPSTTSVQDIPSLLRDMLPKRSEEDKAAEIVRVVFGRAKDQREIEIPVLATRPNRKWREAFNRALAEPFQSATDGEDSMSFSAVLMSLIDVQLKLLIAYDQSGVLPNEEWLLDNATDNQILMAFLGVTAAAFPLEVTAIELVTSNPKVWTRIQDEFWRRMSSLPPSTAGRRDESKPN